MMRKMVDLETIVINDVFKIHCKENDLVTEEANRCLEIFGSNSLERSGTLSSRYA